MILKVILKVVCTWVEWRLLLDPLGPARADGNITEKTLASYNLDMRPRRNFRHHTGPCGRVNCAEALIFEKLLEHFGQA